MTKISSFSLPPICKGEKRGSPKAHEDAKAFAVSDIGILAEEPDGDAGGDADKASVKTDGSDDFLVHFFFLCFQDTDEISTKESMGDFLTSGASTAPRSASTSIGFFFLSYPTLTM